MDEVSRDSEETRNLTQHVLDARNAWENAYSALKEVSSGYLRLKGEHHRMGALFGALPSAARGGTEEAGKPEPAAEN